MAPFKLSEVGERRKRDGLLNHKDLPSVKNDGKFCPRSVIGGRRGARNVVQSSRGAQFSKNLEAVSKF